MTIYRGFTIKAHADGTFTIHSFVAFGNGEPVNDRFPSEEAAMDAIDKIKRAAA